MMDAFFGQAKKMVMETVGLQESVAPDAEFEKWHEHVKRLEGMAVVLRRQFNAYAASMTEMVRQNPPLIRCFPSIHSFVWANSVSCARAKRAQTIPITDFESPQSIDLWRFPRQARASASLTAEVASFYDRSETRKKSVRRFVGTNQNFALHCDKILIFLLPSIRFDLGSVHEHMLPSFIARPNLIESTPFVVSTHSDANTEINAGVTQVYKERFGWEVLALFDKWMDELAAIKQRIRALDELRRNAIAHEEKVKDLQARVSKSTDTLGPDRGFSDF